MTTVMKTKQNKVDHPIAEFCKGLESKSHFILASHVNPEGDAVACVLAMESLLKRLGKKTIIVCEDPFPKRLGCLDSKRWNQVKDIKLDPKYDALIIADCPTLERIGTTRQLINSDTTIFNIDHHVTNLRFGTFNYVQPKASACGEVVYEFFKYFKLPLTKEEAAALYVSISTDTGSFKYSNTTVGSHLIAAELIKTGIDIEAINEDLYATYSISQMKLYSRLMGRVQIDFNGQVAWVGMRRDDLRDSGATYEDAEGFIDFLKYMHEVKFAFFILETEAPNQIRVSLRAKGHRDVSKIAIHFGGGGHSKASGCIIQGTLEKASQLLLAEIKKELK